MSILIRGMEMPKDGSWVTLRVFPDGQCFLYSWCGNDFDFMEHLTAVPVPLHGRLIDADALMRHKGDCYDADGHLLYAVGTGNILRAPTIVPAEEGE